MEENPSKLNLFFSQVKSFFTSNSLLFKFLPVLVLGLAIPATVYLSQQQQSIRNFAAETVKPEVKKEPEFFGYIVEFKSQPSVKSTAGKLTSKLVDNDSIASLRNANTSLLREHQEIKKDLLARIGKNSFDLDKIKKGDKKVKLLGEYTTSFNGIAIDADEDQIAKIKSSPQVKAVHKNYAVKANLMDSVPLIGVDRVWQSVKDKIDGSPVTGKGINIAVLDSGVDYAHPDLGGTNLQERNFIKINNTPVKTIASVMEEQLFSYDGDKVAYSSGNNKVSIYSFSTGKTQTVDVETNLSGSGITTLLLRGDNLFINFLYSGPGSAIYYKNLTTGEFKKVTNITSADGYLPISSRMNYYNGKLYYENNPGTLSEEGTSLQSIYSYDVATSTNSLLIDVQSHGFVMLDISGDKLIYRKGLGGYDNPNRVIVYNLSSGVSQELPMQNVRRVQDIKGDYILYNEYAYGDRYHYYNIVTREDKVIEYPNLTQYQNSQVSDNNTQNVGFKFDSGNLGSIGDGIIFFEKTRNEELIAAYDLSLNRYVILNLKLPIKTIQVQGKKMCFSTETQFDAFSTSNIYCHDYDASFAYPMPANVFNTKVVGGYNFIENNNNPLDDNMHGTHVSEIIAGNGALKGIAPDAKIVAYKVLNKGGVGSFSDIISALDRAIATRTDSDSNNDIDVINLSLGGYCSIPYTADCGPEDPASTAVNNAVDAGIVVVVAAGNDGPLASTIGTPGLAEKAITVGAVDKKKEVTSFSSRGPVILNGHNFHKPDILAPGKEICSATLYGFGFYPSKTCAPGSYISMSGTSMAAPHIAGIAALILQLHPDWTPQQVKDAIKNSADDLHLGEDMQGAGLVNTLKIFNAQTSSPTPTPELKITRIVANQDAYVNKNTPSKNFGKTNTLLLDNNPRSIGYLKFDLTKLAGKQIKSIKLVLTVSKNSASYKNGGADIYVTSNNWQEAKINFNNKPALGTYVYRYINLVKSNTSFTLNLTNELKQYAGQVLSLSLSPVYNFNPGLYVNSSEAVTGKPTLIIEYR